MFFEQVAGLIAILLALVSIAVTLRTLVFLVKSNRGRVTVTFLLTSLSVHLILWDLVRSVLIGIVSGVYFMSSFPDTGILCNIIGPFSHIALRIPFFIALGTLIQSSKSHTNSAVFYRAGWGVVIFGYIASIILSLLPFTKSNSYSHGHLGFCTYYASDVIPVIDEMTHQDILMDEAIITVLPFSAIYIVLAIGTLLHLATRGIGCAATTYPVSILFSFMGMFGVGCFMMIDALGYQSYTALDFYSQFKLDFVVIIAMPILAPVFSYTLTTLKKFKVHIENIIESETKDSTLGDQETDTFLGSPASSKRNSLVQQDSDVCKSTAILVDCSVVHV